MGLSCHPPPPKVGKVRDRKDLGSDLEIDHFAGPFHCFISAVRRRTLPSCRPPPTGFCKVFIRLDLCSRPPANYSKQTGCRQSVQWIGVKDGCQAFAPRRPIFTLKLLYHAASVPFCSLCGGICGQIPRFRANPPALYQRLTMHATSIWGILGSYFGLFCGGGGCFWVPGELKCTTRSRTVGGWDLVLFPVEFGEGLACGPGASGGDVRRGGGGFLRERPLPRRCRGGAGTRRGPGGWRRVCRRR